MCLEEKAKKFKQTINEDLKLMEIHPKVFVFFDKCTKLNLPFLLTGNRPREKPFKVVVEGRRNSLAEWSGVSRAVAGGVRLSAAVELRRRLREVSRSNWGPLSSSNVRSELFLRNHRILQLFLQCTVIAVLQTNLTLYDERERKTFHHVIDYFVYKQM